MGGLPAGGTPVGRLPPLLHDACASARIANEASCAASSGEAAALAMAGVAADGVTASGAATSAASA
eukprot:735573-Prymnesium_polylepis.1